MALRQVVYTSSAVREFSREDLDDLLLKARARNDVNGITGVLIYLEGGFIQLLEGEEEAVWETFGRIGKDPRHSSLIKMTDTAIENREFPGFSMGFRAIYGAELADHPDLFVRVDNRWKLAAGEYFDQKLRVIFDTFFRINAGNV